MVREEWGNAEANGTLPNGGIVKIMVPFWVPIIIRGPNTGPNLGDPKRDHNFDNPPNVFGFRGRGL